MDCQLLKLQGRHAYDWWTWPERCWRKDRHSLCGLEICTWPSRMATGERRPRRSHSRLPDPVSSGTYLSRPAPPPGPPSTHSEASAAPWDFLSAEQPLVKQQQPGTGVMRQPPPPPPPPRKRPPQGSIDGGSGGGGGAGFGTVLLSIVLSAAATAGALQWQTLKDRFIKVHAASQHCTDRNTRDPPHQLWCAHLTYPRMLCDRNHAPFNCSGTRRLRRTLTTEHHRQHQVTVAPQRDIWSGTRP